MADIFWSVIMKTVTFSKPENVNNLVKCSFALHFSSSFGDERDGFLLGEQAGKIYREANIMPEWASITDIWTDAKETFPSIDSQKGLYNFETGFARGFMGF